MPIYYYKCELCNISINLLQDKKIYPDCEKCHNRMKRDPKPPSSQIKEVIDNGAMVKRVEVLPDIQKIMKERSKNNS